MNVKKIPDQQLAGTEMSIAEWVTRLSILGATNRDAYRVVREAMWRFVVENSSCSDFRVKCLDLISFARIYRVDDEDSKTD